MKTHAQPNYMAVFWALLVMTLLEVGVAFLPIAKIVLILSLVGLAIFKAALVALFYMHLKSEGKLIYAIVLVPIAMAVILTLALLKDTAYLY